MTPRRAFAAARRNAFSIVAHTREETDAVLAFNERMRAAHAAVDFLLPEWPNNSHTLGVSPQPIEWTKFVVVDGDDDVRGGFLLMTQPGWLNGGLVDVANYQAPLSEGIIDSRYGMVGMHMLRYVEKHWPISFVVGMGGMDRPLPRLLQAAGWRLHAVPFLFHIVRASRVLRELRVLHGRKSVGVAARMSAFTGAGAIAIGALQHRSWISDRQAPDVRLDRVERWDEWADGLWARTRNGAVFSVVRERAMLECLYPLQDPKYLAFVARRGGDVVGWAIALSTQMSDHNHFGNLRVATVLDAVALPNAAAAVAARVRKELGSQGADLIVTNQTHESWIGAFRHVGFLSGPSNYLFGMSRALSAAIGDRPARVHITRGDGDGRIHL